MLEGIAGGIADMHGLAAFWILCYTYSHRSG